MINASAAGTPGAPEEKVAAMSDPPCLVHHLCEMLTCDIAQTNPFTGGQISSLLCSSYCHCTLQQRVFRVSSCAAICNNEVKRLRSGGNNWYKIFNLVDKAPCNALQHVFWKLALTLTVPRWLGGCRHIRLDLFIESA